MARQLRTHGFEVAVLEGGYAAWKAGYPVEPKPGEMLDRLVATS